MTFFSQERGAANDYDISLIEPFIGNDQSRDR
jgi:hypothetical protein